MARSHRALVLALSTRTIGSKCFLGQQLRDILRGGFGSAGHEIAFSTVSSFKGLEAEVVLLVDDLSSADGSSRICGCVVCASRSLCFISD
jgi:hypothetical protein